MSNENEATADIITEMRERAEAMQTHGTTHGVKLAVREFADRIEAAWKRECEASRAYWTKKCRDTITEHDRYCSPVGNAAAMREALVKCREIALQWQADEADGVAGTTDKPSARSAAEAVIDMEFEINAALAEPARNCDWVKADEEAKYRFLQIAELPEGNGDAEMREWYRKLIAWLFEPAKKGEGDAN